MSDIKQNNPSNQINEDDVQKFEMMMGVGGNAKGMIASKITPKHIDKILAIAKDEQKSDSDAKKMTIRYGFWLFIGILVFLVAVLWLVLSNYPEYTLQVITIFLSTFGGGGIGFTIGKNVKNN